MEHFPTVLKPYQPLMIPYLGGSWNISDDIACSDLELVDFDSRRAAGQISHEEEERFVRDLQARLCFGMLHGVLQLEDFNFSEYIIDSPDGKSKIFTTRKLREHLGRWQSDHNTVSSQCHSKEHETNTTIAEPHIANAEELLNARRERAERCLNDAYNSWCYIQAETLGGQDQSKKLEFLQVELSIQVLGTALEHAIESVSSDCRFCPFQQWVGSFGVPWRRNKSNTYLFDRMTGQGWCPTVVEGLRKQGGLSSMYYASLLAPPTRKNRDHSNCKPTDKACSWTNTRAFDYKPLHVEDGCTCNMIGPDGGMEQISDILREDGIPLLYYEDGKLGVEAQRRSTAYTAISHVWADGLGNLGKNFLPRCQFDQVKKYISEVSIWSKALDTNDEVYDDDIWKAKDSVGDRPSLPLDLMSRRCYFWIDTICIPRDDEKLRDKAITQMRAVYKRANRVLVLDADLMNTTIALEDPSKFELRPDFHLKISASNWQKRYWTLQEAVLARKLYFQFANGAFEKATWGDFIEQQVGATELIRYTEKHGEWRPNFIEYCYDNEVLYYAEETSFDWFRETQVIRKIARQSAQKEHYGQTSPVPEQAPRARIVWSALALRACSFDADKARCMGILLDMDISIFTIPDEVEALAKEQVAKLAPGDEKGRTTVIDKVRSAYRTKRFWEEMSAIPAGLLCFPAAKHKESHLRWAPTELDIIHMAANPVTLPAHISPEGIRLRLHGIRLNENLKREPKSVIPIKLRNKVYFIRNNLTFDNEAWTELDNDNNLKRNVNFNLQEHLAVILGQEPLEPDSSIPDFVAGLGALVSIKRQEPGPLLVVRYIGAISIFTEDSVFNARPKRPWTTEELEERRYIDDDGELCDGSGGRGGGRRGGGGGAASGGVGENESQNAKEEGDGGKGGGDLQVQKLAHATFTEIDQAWFIEF